MSRVSSSFLISLLEARHERSGPHMIVEQKYDQGSIYVRLFVPKASLDSLMQLDWHVGFASHGLDPETAPLSPSVSYYRDRREPRPSFVVFKLEGLNQFPHPLALLQRGKVVWRGYHYDGITHASKDILVACHDLSTVRGKVFFSCLLLFIFSFCFSSVLGLP